MRLFPSRRRRGPSGPDVFSAALLEDLAVAVIACDADGEIVLVNRRARELQDVIDYEPALRRALGGEQVRDRRVLAHPLLDGRGEVLGAAVVALEKGSEDPDVLGTVPGALALVRAADGIVVHVNEAWERLFGYRADEVVGRHMSADTPTGPNTASARAQEIVRALERDGRWEGEVERARKDGSRFWSAETLWVLEHPEHGRAWAALFTDVTARRAGELALREDEERFRTIFECAPLGLAMLDDRGCVLDANPAFSWIAGLARDELVGMHIDDLTHDDDCALDADLLNALERGELRRYRVVKRFVAASGAEVPVALTTSMVRDSDGRALYRVVVAEDPAARAATATW